MDRHTNKRLKYYNQISRLRVRFLLPAPYPEVAQLEGGSSLRSCAVWVQIPSSGPLRQ